MKKPLLAICVLLAYNIHAQSVKSTRVDITVPSYALIPAPEGYITYMGAVGNTEGSVLPFTEAEFQNALKLQSFTLSEGENSSPDLFFVVNGVDVGDLNITYKRSKANERYDIEILPKASTSINVLTMAKGEATHISRLSVLPKSDGKGGLVPEIISFSFDESEKYLIIEDEDSVKASPYLVEQYLKRVLGDNFLRKDLVSNIYNKYDNRADITSEKLYYLKDKKNPALQESTEGNLKALEELSKGFTTIDKLRNGKEELNSFSDFWKTQLANYDLSSKDGGKIGWGILMNLVQVSIMQEDYAAAQGFMNQAIDLKEKKWITNSAKSQLDKLFKSYELNYDAASGDKIYGPEFEIDGMLASIAKKSEVKGNNITKETGYILKDDGEKIEGKISMRFSPEESDGGNIADLSGDTTAKRVTVYYVNEKGKNKSTSLKCKEVSEVFIGDRVFQSVNPKKNFLEQEALSLGMLNNTIFMERVYSSDKIKLFKDLTAVSQYYFEIPGVKKAERASAEFFASCDVLAKRIESEEFTETEEDQIKIAKAYTDSCN
ncbi:hypothetical protein H0I23_15520 [Cellulophaga sp. HaHaR_3_176]|uniref:hypothetical protein n=1 Tax=Cellulophaga sp. HaHaR_3_176 TaxID=1942464 RepID=UPI001C2003D4|nr:hypothetical protein [Cellulophaga sp. HaHaR_3_176]QWX83841.1 hypothetical protein H0I23_15520 [Cellulophaga sp. HaHaR_3_176]